MTAYCNAKKRQGEGLCQRPAGWGTDHVGVGHCKLHGGASLKGAELPQYKHGRYSKYAPATLQKHIDDLGDSDVLDLAQELQTQRALIASYIERYKDTGSMSEYTIGQTIAWLNTVGAMVERIMRIRNETALTSAELALLKMRTADLVVKYIDDPDKQRAFVAELFGISQTAELE